MADRVNPFAGGAIHGIDENAERRPARDSSW